MSPIYRSALTLTPVQIPLDAVYYPTWAATVYLPPNTAFQYKFIRKEKDGSVSFFPYALLQDGVLMLYEQIVWESDPNRQDTTPASGTQPIVSNWR